MKKIRCLIFTEAGENYGFGHLTRCIALYDELNFRGVDTKLIVKGDSSVGKAAKSRNLILDDWYSNWESYLENMKAEIVYSIIDSYHAGFSVYKNISEKSVQAIYIDDMNRMKYPAGIIVNPCLKGIDGYQIGEDQKLLSGSNYIILRQAFTKPITQRTPRNEIKKILVSLGGSDIRNLTPLVMKCLIETVDSNVEISIIIGSGFQNIKEIESCAEDADQRISLCYDLLDWEMRELMIHCDLAITAAGQTVNELIATQTPFICIKIIDNQEENIRGLMEKKLITSYFDYNKFSSNLDFRIWLEGQILYLSDKQMRQKMILQMSKERIAEGTTRIVDALLMGR